jgi:transposase-like protein
LLFAFDAIVWSSPGFVDVWRLCRLAGGRGCLSMPETPSYSEGFWAEAVRLLKFSGRLIPQLARGLGCSEQSLRSWWREVDVDDGKGRGSER